MKKLFVLVVSLLSLALSFSSAFAGEFEPTFDWVDNRIDTQESFRESVSCYANLGAQGVLNVKAFLYHYHYKLDLSLDSVLEAHSIQQQAAASSSEHQETLLDQIYVIHYPSFNVYKDFAQGQYWEQERKRRGYSDYNPYLANEMDREMEKQWNGELTKLPTVEVPTAFNALLSQKSDAENVTIFPVGHVWNEQTLDRLTYASLYAPKSIFGQALAAKRNEIIRKEKLSPLFWVVFDEKNLKNSKIVTLGKKKVGLPIVCQPTSRTPVYF